MPEAADYWLRPLVSAWNWWYWTKRASALAALVVDE